MTRVGPPPPIANQPRPMPTPQPTPTLDGPKCYPETATVYFLPAPPSAPKITVLDPNTYKEGKMKTDIIPERVSTVKEIPITEEKPQKSCDAQLTGRDFPPPPPLPCSTGLPDLLGDIPSLLKNRLIRNKDDKPCACESCAQLLKKLPIFNFDQELLDGFLNGIKL
ncbi:unnamed protein product [Chrysodeixis includens]|uniref:Uncharacterized protein n=1 Tax=Chrysodeixis includens TaxID=689277 RepID=A0A9N8Q349_CHRIL|nr:unnamed protein product [Chrysodeixis includens]